MHRIDTKTAQKDKFGAGKNGFTRGNPQTGTPATDLDDDYFDMLQEELCGVVEASGASLEKGRNDQLLTALRALLLSRKNPFGDIKSDGTVKTALQNLGLGEAAKRDVGTGENQIPDMASFASGNGWMKLPNGKILQYGRGAVTPTLSTQTMRITFSIPFPKKADCAMLTHSGDGGAPLGAGRGFVMTAEGPTLTGFNSAYRTSSTSDTVSMNYSWWAVGE
ncbi:TPA: gp53-like domain-containing protein [Escherichia coli]|uniref:gp53-like domain-containing protein n=1 Tax=Escherichia coli TaxID=562 RepID=UPI003B524668